jgi:hypothetical protein
VNYTRLALKICGLAFVGVLIAISVFPRSRNLICGFNTEEEIFEVMKRHLLDPENKTLAANHLDASIFDNIMHGEIIQICRRPKSFWFIRQEGDFSPWKDSWPVYVTIVTLVKGNCEECWDRVVIGASVSRCGTIHQFRVSREPNGIRPIGTRNGKAILQQYCGPVSNDQADVSR